jgi:hypothetical protein
VLAADAERLPAVDEVVAVTGRLVAEQEGTPHHIAIG